jgi:hypothetical protein
MSDFDELERRKDVVPGVMHCARCKLRLQRVNLYVNVGAVGAGDNVTEPCPNGCGPLWPVTWEQEAREGYKLSEDLFERATRAEDALRNAAPSLIAIARASIDLHDAVDAMMAPLGCHGTISARDDRVQAVMDALAQWETATMSLKP